jgi:hypothetical protein
LTDDGGFPEFDLGAFFEQRSDQELRETVGDYLPYHRMYDQHAEPRFAAAVRSSQGEPKLPFGSQRTVVKVDDHLLSNTLHLIGLYPVGEWP